MAVILMYIPNDDTQNPFCRLKLMVETFEYSTNQNPTKVVKPSQRIRNHYFKNSGD